MVGARLGVGVVFVLVLGVTVVPVRVMLCPAAGSAVIAGVVLADAVTVRAWAVLAAGMVTCAWSWYWAGVVSVAMSPRVQTGLPPPLGHDVVKAGVSVTGVAARVTMTAVAGPPWAVTWMVQETVLPRLTLSCAACTPTHSWVALAAVLGVGLGGAESVADADGAGGVGSGWHSLVVTAVVTAAMAGGVCTRSMAPCMPPVKCHAAYNATSTAMEVTGVLVLPM